MKTLGIVLCLLLASCTEETAVGGGEHACPQGTFRSTNTPEQKFLLVNGESITLYYANELLPPPVSYTCEAGGVLVLENGLRLYTAEFATVLNVEGPPEYAGMYQKVGGFKPGHHGDGSSCWQEWSAE